MKVTFKKQPKETGLAAVGSPNASVDIKINGLVVGHIVAPTWQTKDNKWSVQFAVKKTELDGNPNCDWKWVSLKKRFDDDKEARVFIKNNIQRIVTVNKYEFACLEDLIYIF